MKRKLFLLGLLAVFMSGTQAQISPFLEKGTNGIGLNVYGETSYGYNGAGASLAGSLKGRADLVVTYMYDNYPADERELINGDASSGLFDIELTYWFIRKNLINGLELNMGASGGYVQCTYDDYVTAGTNIGQTYQRESWYNGLLGLNTNMNFEVSQNWFVEPRFNVDFELGVEKDIDNSTRQSLNYHGFSSSLGIAVFKRWNKGSVVSVAIDQHQDSYGSYNWYVFSIGAILAINPT